MVEGHVILLPAKQLAIADIEELARGCRFSDCVHNNEPGCAVQAAVRAAGTLSAGRLQNYVKLQHELSY